MSRPARAVFPFSTIILSLFLAACAGGPRTAETERREFLVARDGVLQFLVPDGWFNASKDVRSPDEIIWLVRHDYTATISVRDIHMDDEARRILQRDGLLRLAQVTIGLTPQAVVTSGPTMVRHEGREYCSYETMVAPENDIVRVALVDTGTKVYEVRTLVSGKRSPAGALAVEEEFVLGLRW